MANINAFAEYMARPMIPFFLDEEGYYFAYGDDAQIVAEICGFEVIERHDQPAVRFNKMFADLHLRLVIDAGYRVRFAELS